MQYRQSPHSGLLIAAVNAEYIRLKLRHTRPSPQRVQQSECARVDRFVHLGPKLYFVEPPKNGTA